MPERHDLLGYFLGSVFAYDLLDEQSGILVAAFLPYLELSLSIALWFPEMRRASLLWMFLLFSVYALAQGSALVRGLRISCGCFGPSSDDPISIGSLSFAAGMAIAALISFLMFALSRTPSAGQEHGDS